MKKSIMPKTMKEAVIWIVESVLNAFAEHRAKLGDMDQKLDHIIKSLPKDRNGQNHQ